VISKPLQNTDEFINQNGENKNIASGKIFQGMTTSNKVFEDFSLQNLKYCEKLYTKYYDSFALKITPFIECVLILSDQLLL
jgi:hypothetical protein